MAIVSLASSIACHNNKYLRQTSCLRSRSSIFGRYVRVQIPQNRKRFFFIRETPRGMSIKSSVQPGSPFPPEPPSGSWTKWIIGALITFAIPFLSNKWGSFLILTKKVETTIERVDNVVEIIEEAAKKVDKVAEEIVDKLPQGGKIRNTVEVIEHVAEEVVKDARFVDDILDKVEEVDKELESFMDKDKGKVIPEKLNDQN